MRSGGEGAPTFQTCCLTIASSFRRVGGARCEVTSFTAPRFGRDKHSLGTEGICWPRSHGLSNDPCAKQLSPRQTDGCLPSKEPHWPPPDPTVSAHAPTGPCALANGWGGHPGRSSSWALGGRGAGSGDGGREAAGMRERGQQVGGGEETEGRWLSQRVCALPGLAEVGDGSVLSPSTLNPRLSGWSLFSDWKSLAKALDTNRNTALEAKVRCRRQTEGPGSMDTHCTTLGGP